MCVELLRHEFHLLYFDAPIFILESRLYYNYGSGMEAWFPHFMYFYLHQNYAKSIMYF